MRITKRDRRFLYLGIAAAKLHQLWKWLWFDDDPKPITTRRMDYWG